MERKRLNDFGENDFTGTQEEWEDRIFNNVDLFRVHQLSNGKVEKEMNTTSFPQALVAAEEVTKADKEVLVYAVSKSGRYVCLPPERWNHFAELWIAKHGRTQHDEPALPRSQ